MICFSRYTLYLRLYIYIRIYIYSFLNNNTHTQYIFIYTYVYPFAWAWTTAYPFAWMASSSGEYLHDRPGTAGIAITALNEMQKHNWGKFMIITSTAQTAQDVFHSHMKLEMAIADGVKLSMTASIRTCICDTDCMESSQRWLALCILSPAISWPIWSCSPPSRKMFFGTWTYDFSAFAGFYSCSCHW